MEFQNLKLSLLALAVSTSIANGAPIRRDHRTAQADEVVVALIGDTEAGQGFGSVLELVASERAQVVMINGDFGYFASPSKWKQRLVDSIDTEKHLVIGSLGNHDVGSKNEYLAAFQSFRTNTNGLKSKCSGTIGISEGHDITIVDEVCKFGNVSIISSGIGQVLKNSYLEDRLSNKLAAAPNDDWKLVGYHYTLSSMNPGIKGSENTARFFDLIRQYGAIGVQAHTHTVMASCPISSAFTSGSSVPSCNSSFGSDLENRFIAPGTSVYLDSSIGGKETRSRQRCKTPGSSDCKHMVDIISNEGYTRTDGIIRRNLPDAGAMFVVFNQDRDPKKAYVYFKTIDGQKIFDFTITR